MENEKHFAQIGERYIGGSKLVFGLGHEDRRHHLYVIGQKGNDWTVFDPGWTQAWPNALPGTQEDDTLLESLAAHTNRFATRSSAGNKVSWRFSVESVRTFRMGSASNPALYGIGKSPIAILEL